MAAVVTITARLGTDPGAGVGGVQREDCRDPACLGLWRHPRS